MQYREFGKERSSILGFGAMRLPCQSDGSVDDSAAIDMIRKAIDLGVDYFDTAYVYHGGYGEAVVGRGLAGLREKVTLATKSPVWKINESGDFDKLLDEQLKRLNVEYIDNYLLHSLSALLWERKVLRFDLIKKVEAARAAGKIGKIGFSFHDNFGAFRTIIEAYQWDFCQIQLNYQDTLFQAGLEGLKLAKSLDIPVVAMEPLRGGELADPPKNVAAVFPPEKTPVEWALAFVWNLPGVATVLSGMSSMEQLLQNARYAEHFTALSEAEIAVFDDVRSEFARLNLVPCTGCNYCMPCPFGVNIPKNFNTYNPLKNGNLVTAKENFDNMLIWSGKTPDAKHCTDCGVCREKCPQGIDVPKLMSEMAQAFLELA